MKYISVFFQYLRHNGIKVTFERCLSFMKRKLRRSHAAQSVIPKRPIDVMTSVEDVVKADFVTEPYIAPKKINKTKLNIGWVLSPISIGSGGQHTIARFAKSLQERGHNITFFIYRINKAFKIAIIYKIVIIYEKNKFSTSFSYS